MAITLINNDDKPPQAHAPTHTTRAGAAPDAALVTRSAVQA
jgi:hypothetical protein